MDLRLPQLQGDSIRQELLKQYVKATSTSTDDVDLLAIDLFATMVQQYETSITMDATKIIAAKFKSSNADEVLLALNVLEECMAKCGPRFHNEVGKFRFLNELIRLVSPQYDGDKTPKKVRDKILDLMLLWTKNFPHEIKIKEAYDMLIKRGVRHEYVKQPTVKNAHKIGPSLDEMKIREKAEPDLAAKLKGLLHSSNPADIKAANLLIQNMVKEKERRHEVKMRRKLELKEITENASLLKDMLDQVEKARENDVEENTTEDGLATMKYLYESCRRLQPTISILLGDTEESECLQDALDANEYIAGVFQKYSNLIIKVAPTEASSCLINTSDPRSDGCIPNGKNTMDELSEIFASSNSNPTNNGHSYMHSTLEPTPIVLEPTPIASNFRSHSNFIQDWEAMSSSSEGILTTSANTLDQLLNNSENMSREASIPGPKAFSIPPTATSAISQEKANATQLKFQNFDTELTELISGLKSNLKRDFDDSPLDPDDDKSLLQIDSEPIDPAPADELITPHEPIVESHDIEMIKQTMNQTANSNRRLADIVIDLNTIRPHNIHVPRCILDDKSGLKVVLNFAKDKPRSDVAVLVITTTNQSHSPVTNYQFEASASKPCKLHLQKPSGHELPGVKPFRPPTDDITQVLLISMVEQKPLKLVCIISYVLGDDPDPNKEFLEINDLPDLFS